MSSPLPTMWAKRNQARLAASVPTERTRLAASGPQAAACSLDASCPVMQLRLSWRQDVHGLGLATLSAFRDFDTIVGSLVCFEDECNN